MKKSILSSILLLTVFLCAKAQGDVTYEHYKPKAGDQLAYHVNSSGNEYDFIVKPVTLKWNEDYPIVFDWNMTAPVNKNGTIKIAKDAAKKSNAMYNWFSGGEKILTDATSVFVSTEVLANIRKAKQGDVIKIRVNGAAAPEEDFILDSDSHPYRYYNHGANEEMITTLLRNKENGHTVIIYREGLNGLIVSMSIGFDIALESVK